MKNQTKKILSRVLKESRKFSYFYKLGLWKKRWIDLFDVITAIQTTRTESGLDKLTLEVLLRLEVQLNEMIKKHKSLPWKAFKIIMKTAIRSIVI